MHTAMQRRARPGGWGAREDPHAPRAGATVPPIVACDLPRMYAYVISPDICIAPTHLAVRSGPWTCVCAWTWPDVCAPRRADQPRTLSRRGACGRFGNAGGEPSPAASRPVSDMCCEILRPLRTGKAAPCARKYVLMCTCRALSNCDNLNGVLEGDASSKEDIQNLTSRAVEFSPCGAVATSSCLCVRAQGSVSPGGAYERARTRDAALAPLASTSPSQRRASRGSS